MGYIPSSSTNIEHFIYPFGCNESQKLAVESSLTSKISIIEGPPGTGKTQTILNLIANLIINKRSVAVVSNNNAAVFNVIDKLEREGYGFVVAPLGNNENKSAFFDNFKEQKIDPSYRRSILWLRKAKKELDQLSSLLSLAYKSSNRVATLKAKLSDAEIEFSHLKVEQPLDPAIKSTLDSKFYRKWSVNKTLKLIGRTSSFNPKKRVSTIEKLHLFLYYGLFDFEILSLYQNELPLYLNHKFYTLYISKLQREISKVERWLNANHHERNLKRYIELSKEIFNAFLFEKYSTIKKVKFSAKGYLNQFDRFIKQFPLISSSTLSLHNSIPKGYLLDYLIIDESSQVDVIKASLCFSCSRNVVVVGDSMQLTHIVDKKSEVVVEAIQKQQNILPPYNYLKHNIIGSLKNLYGNKIKTVLLREHYRCHPAIIGFCNKKYYNDSLVVMTNGTNNPFKIIETNISGERENYNRRQIDETNLYIQENYRGEYSKIGVIAPYRRHADMLQEQLPNGVESDTIHKFQGREKDIIIFNVVRNRIDHFIDNPNLINVAVSRAVKEFVLVKPQSMDIPHGTNIGDLIRYISYTTDPETTFVKGKISSVFDLLYKEYNREFSRFRSQNREIKGSAAEVIIDKLLNEKILSKGKYSSIALVREYRLRDLVTDLGLFSEEELKFIRANSRIDFLLYSKIDKTPLLAIEVDGVSFHSNQLQQERDRKKDRILQVTGLPIVRLSTNEHNEEKRIVESLNWAMAKN